MWYLLAVVILVALFFVVRAIQKAVAKQEALEAARQAVLEKSVRRAREHFETDKIERISRVPLQSAPSAASGWKGPEARASGLVASSPPAASPSTSGDGFLTSMVVAQMTDSPLLGTLAGGNLVGALVGSSLANHNHESSSHVSDDIQPSSTPVHDTPAPVLDAPAPASLPEPSYSEPRYSEPTFSEPTFHEQSFSSPSDSFSDSSSSSSSSDSGSSSSSDSYSSSSDSGGGGGDF